MDDLSARSEQVIYQTRITVLCAAQKPDIVGRIAIIHYPPHYYKPFNRGEIIVIE